MNNCILVHNVSEHQLVALISEDIKRQLQNLKNDLSLIEESKDLLTRREACSFLKINSSTLWTWTNKGKITSYAIGHKRYYKRSELIQSLTPLKKL